MPTYHDDDLQLLRRYQSRQMEEPGVPGTETREMELVRRYRSDGSLEAAGVRIRESSRRDPPPSLPEAPKPVEPDKSVQDEADFLALLWIGTTYAVAAGAGTWVLDAWWGAAIGVVIWSWMIWGRM